MLAKRAPVASIKPQAWCSERFQVWNNCFEICHECFMLEVEANNSVLRFLFQNFKHGEASAALRGGKVVALRSRMRLQRVAGGCLMVQW